MNLDREFPSLSALPSKGTAVVAPAVIPVPVKTTPPPSVSPAAATPPTLEQQLAMFDVTSPVSFTNNSLGPNDFGHAVSAAISYIPDVPGEADEVDNGQSKNKFPQLNSGSLSRLDFFRKLDVSTLCYIFFHSPGMPRQYLASEEMKRRGWRFNAARQHETWFRNVGEPIERTSTYEVGKFEYFDCKDGWGVRSCPGQFKLEYSDLAI